MTAPASNPPDPPPLAAVLKLIALQLEEAMRQSSAQAERLSKSVAEVTAIAGSLAARLGETADAALVAQVSALQAEARRAMTAMQFHDPLAQRVLHVRDALADIHEELRSGRNPEWGALLARMRAQYTIDDERRLFDQMLGSLPSGTRRQEDTLPGSVELF